jgi:deazaflavin-dependent oxidoreductase (nitroreductase family)
VRGYTGRMARRDASDLYGAEHIRQYRETGGDYGHDWKGTQTLLLTTTGRRSGEPRTTPLIYGRNGDDFLVVASKGGADEPPAWYVNLQHQPEAEIQVLDETIPVRARTAADAEKPDLWETMVAEWPAYDDYQRKTDRPIPVVVLERR